MVQGNQEMERSIIHPVYEVPERTPAEVLVQVWLGSKDLPPDVKSIEPRGSFLVVVYNDGHKRYIGPKDIQDNELCWKFITALMYNAMDMLGDPNLLPVFISSVLNILAAVVDVAYTTYYGPAGRAVVDVWKATLNRLSST